MIYKQQIDFQWDSRMDYDSQTPETTVLKTDWHIKSNQTICAYCQYVISEALRCPADTKRSDLGAGYKTLAANIEKLAKLGCMPKVLCLSRLDESNGIEETFFWKTRHVGIKAFQFNEAKKS